MVRSVLLTLKITVAFVAMGPAVTAAHGQSIRYVDDNAALGGDGLTWPTAYSDLQGALDVVNPGDEIHVAQGIYLLASLCLPIMVAAEPSDKPDQTLEQQKERFRCLAREYQPFEFKRLQARLKQLRAEQRQIARARANRYGGVSPSRAARRAKAEEIAQTQRQLRACRLGGPTCIPPLNIWKPEQGAMGQLGAVRVAQVLGETDLLVHWELYRIPGPSMIGGFRGAGFASQADRMWYTREECKRMGFPREPGPPYGCPGSAPRSLPMATK
ncbi:MAG: hypothetical protein ACYSUI_08495 [Planctomycetota bacterium]